MSYMCEDENMEEILSINNNNDGEVITKCSTQQNFEIQQEKKTNERNAEKLGVEDSFSIEALSVNNPLIIELPSEYIEYKKQITVREFKTCISSVVKKSYVDVDMDMLQKRYEEEKENIRCFNDIECIARKLAINDIKDTNPTLLLIKVNDGYNFDSCEKNSCIKKKKKTYNENFLETRYTDGNNTLCVIEPKDFSEETIETGDGNFLIQRCSYSMYSDVHYKKPSNKTKESISNKFEILITDTKGNKIEFSKEYFINLNFTCELF